MQPLSRHSPRAAAAARSATTSACAVGSSVGLADVAAPADDRAGRVQHDGADRDVAVRRRRRASSRASAHPASYRRAWSSRPAQSRAASTTASYCSPKPSRAATDRASRRGRGRSRREHRQLHGGQAEVGEDRQVAGGATWSSSSSGWSQPEVVEHGARELPLVGGGDVGEQEPDVVAEHPRGDEEVLVDRDQAERAAVAGVLPQRVQEGRELVAEPHRQRLDLPDAVLAVGDHGEVDAGVVHGAHRGRDRRPARQARCPAARPAPPPLTSAAMRTLVVDHPLVAHKLTALRDENTDSPTFRRLADELVTLLAYEATREVRVEPVDIVTPVAPTDGRHSWRSPSRWSCRSCAPGSGMLDGMMRLLPTAEVGFLGMMRNEETLEASTYAERLPDDLSGRQCYVLDPMLATGGTLVAAIHFLARPRRRPHHRDLPARRARGLRRARERARGADVPVTVVTAGDGREAQREGLHRPRPRRRRRPPLRRRLTSTGCGRLTGAATPLRAVRGP